MEKTDHSAYLHKPPSSPRNKVQIWLSTWANHTHSEFHFTQGKPVTRTGRLRGRTRPLLLILLPCSPTCATSFLDWSPGCVSTGSIFMVPAPEVSWQLDFWKGWIVPLGPWSSDICVLFSHVTADLLISSSLCFTSLSSITTAADPTFWAPASRQGWLPLHLCRKKAANVL